MVSAPAVRALEPDDRPWVRGLIAERWGAATIVVHGTLFLPAELPGLVAERDGERVGLLTYDVREDGCEIVTLDSMRSGVGVGTALIEAAKETARRVDCRRLWLTTTNDNLDALRFYQRRGFVLAALHREAVTAARRLKPEIPPIGAHGIPIRDEIELETTL